MADALIHDTTFQQPLIHRGPDAAGAAHGVDGAQVVFVALLGRQAVLQRHAQTGAVQRLLDVVRRQGIASEQYVQIALADQPTDELDAAGVDDGGTEHRQDLLASGPGAAHGPGDFADGDALGLFAGNGAGHELEQVLPGGGRIGEDTQALPADDDAVALASVDHRQAAGGGALRVEDNAAVLLLVLHVHPVAAEPDLRAQVRGGVEVLGKGPIQIGGNGDAIVGGGGRGTVVVDGGEDVAQDGGAGRVDLDAGPAGIAGPPADVDVLERVGAAACQNLVEHLGQQQRVDDVTFQVHFFNKAGRNCHVKDLRMNELERFTAAWITPRRTALQSRLRDKDGSGEPSHRLCANQV